MAKEGVEGILRRKRAEEEKTKKAAELGNPFFDVERGFPKKKVTPPALPSFEKPGEHRGVGGEAAGEEEGWDKKIAAAKEKIEETEWEEKEWKAKLDAAHGDSEGVKKSKE